METNIGGFNRNGINYSQFTIPSFRCRIELREKNPNNDFCFIERTESLFLPNFFNHNVDESVVST